MTAVKLPRRQRDLEYQQLLDEMGFDTGFPAHLKRQVRDGYIPAVAIFLTTQVVGVITGEFALNLVGISLQLGFSIGWGRGWTSSNRHSRETQARAELFKIKHFEDEVLKHTAPDDPERKALAEAKRHWTRELERVT